MNAETEMKLARLEMNIELRLESYKVQLKQFQDELAEETNPECKEVLNRWIWMNEKRIELLNSLLK